MSRTAYEACRYVWGRYEAPTGHRHFRWRWLAELYADWRELTDPDPCAFWPVAPIRVTSQGKKI
jgi:hypothetical protein